MSRPDGAPPTPEFRSRELLRRVREAGREAARDAREAGREAAREARETAREAAREAREAARAGGSRERRESEPGTRTRIQQIALELFTEHGYEATSLREIAERLGVTKAALYYHFKTKDEIIDSLINDQSEAIGRLIAWARQQPRTRETRCEFIRQYSAMLHEGEHHRLMRFIERNQSSMAQHKGGMQMRERLRQMLGLLTDPGAPLATQIRCSLAIFALHSTWLTVQDPSVTDEQRDEAALEVALGLLD